MARTLDDLARKIPDQDAYDRAISRAVRKSTDLLAVVGALHVPPNGQTERPTWLQPMADAYVRAEAASAGRGKPVLALISAPPQCGKTTLAEVAYAWWLARRPQDPLGWLSYGAELSRDKSRRIRDLARKLQVQIRTDSAAAERWQTTAGGGLLAKGLGGAIVGMSGLACVVVDDPYESKAKAYSIAHRKWVRSQIQASVMSRRNPRTSVFVQHHRWAVDDVIGWLQDEWCDLFEVIVVQAVDPETEEPIVTLGGRDRAFWSEARRIAGPEWWPLYMGSPRSREGGLFQESGVAYYGRLPDYGQTAIGVDFAYSTRTSSDYSTAVVLRRIDQRAYVVEVVRGQWPAPAFAERLAGLQRRYGNPPTHAYIGNEQGVVDLFVERGAIVSGHRTTTDKVARAQTCAADWNMGHILLPEGTADTPQPAWVAEFVAEVLNFGAGGHDDQVDALVSAFDFCRWHGSSVGVGAATRQVQQLRVWDSGTDRNEKIRQAVVGGVREDVPDGSSRPMTAWKPGVGRLPSKHGW